MAKLNKWANIIKNVANRMKGKLRRERRNDNVPSMDPTTPDVKGETTQPKRSLGIMNKAFENMKKRNKPEVNPAFDIFPEDMQSQYENQTDKEVSREVDDYKTGVETYLNKKKSKKDITPTEYNENNFDTESEFSSPDIEQENPVITNEGGYEELEDTSVSYDDPVISTKPTPTSEKLGLARPGPSSFIQTAKYNPSTRQLNIAYTDGKVFPYHNVSPEMADKILKERPDHSPGQTVNKTIFKGHGTTKADEIDSIEEGM